MHDKNPFSVQSEITIGVIGPEALIQKTKEALKSFPNFNPFYHITTQENENLDFLREIPKRRFWCSLNTVYIKRQRK